MNDYGTDNNSFVNTMNKAKYEAAGFADVSDYTIDDTYFEKLTKDKRHIYFFLQADDFFS